MATVTQAAEELGITPRAVLLRIKNGEMRAERVGPRATLIPRDEIERWKAVGKRKGGRPPKARAETEAQAPSSEQKAATRGRRKGRDAQG